MQGRKSTSLSDPNIFAGTVTSAVLRKVVPSCFPCWDWFFHVPSPSEGAVAISWVAEVSTTSRPHRPHTNCRLGMSLVYPWKGLYVFYVPMRPVHPNLPQLLVQQFWQWVQSGSVSKCGRCPAFPTWTCDHASIIAWSHDRHVIVIALVIHQKHGPNLKDCQYPLISLGGTGKLREKVVWGLQ